MKRMLIFALIVQLAFVGACGSNIPNERGIIIDAAEANYTSFLLYGDPDKLGVEFPLTVEKARDLAEKELSRAGYCPEGVLVKENGFGYLERSRDFVIRAYCR